MLNENNIVKLLAEYLKSNGYEIVQALDTVSRGPDIIADNIKTKHRLFVEVKGETSSKEHTNRYGKPFDGKQIRNHIARAVFTAMQVLTSKPAGDKTKAAIALPLTAGHQKELETVRNAIKRLDIKVFFVDSNGVKEE